MSDPAKWVVVDEFIPSAITSVIAAVIVNLLKIWLAKYLINRFIILI